MSHAKSCLCCVVKMAFFWKNVIDFFFVNQISKWRSYEKKSYFWPTFNIFKSPGKRHKKFFSTYPTYIHTRILLTLYWLFCFPNFATIANLSCMISLWCDFWCWFFFVPFWSNQEITKWWEKFRLECLLLIFIYTNGKSIAICKPRTLNNGSWRLSSIQKTQKKHCFLVAAIFVFIGKIVIT